MKVSLYKGCSPGLPVGAWELNVKQSVHKDGDEVLANGASGETFFLHVGSLPARLSKHDILALYPHEGASEVEEGRIPHIVLRDRGFPWLTGDTDGNPWVALLLFQVTETDTGWAIEGSGTIRVGGTLGELETKWNRPGAARQVFARAPGVDLAEPACWIEMEGAKLKTYLPEAGEAALLSHVRNVPANLDEFKDDEDGFVAITLANRAVMGRGLTWAACLVSLRQPGNWDVRSLPDDLTACVPVLHLWTFRSSDKKGDFESLALGLKSGSFGQGVSDDAGRVELSCTTREGKTERCLYHPPLVPIRYQRKTGDALPWKEHLPLVRADEAGYYTRDESGARVYDLSYAAAFELGRLRALSDQDFLRLLIDHRSVVSQKRWQTTGEALLVPGLKERLARIRGGLEALSQRGALMGLSELMRDPVLGQLVDKARFQSKVEAPGVGLAEDPSGIAQLQKVGNIKGLSDEYRTRTNRARPGRDGFGRVDLNHAGRDWLDDKLERSPEIPIDALRGELRNFQGTR